MSTFKIRLRGQELPKEISQAEDQALGNYQVSRTFSVESATRSDIPEQLIELKEGEILELDFDDNTFWLGDADTIRQIYSKDLKRGGDLDEINLSGDIESDEQDRGLVQKILVKAAKVFVKREVINPGIKKLATKAENSALEFGGKSFENEGAAVILSVGENFELAKADFSKVDLSKNCLLFIHGTGSSTVGSFGEMKATDEWKEMVKHYGPGNILAIQHRTLTCSPLENVLEAFKQLPSGITLDLVTHSRGGLVGDLIARFASANQGFGDVEKGVLKDNKRQGDLNVIAEISNLIGSKTITVNRMVRVACPANGTTLASDRMDLFLNVIINLLGTAIGSITNPVFTTMKELIMTAIETKDDVSVLPGLESMNPKSPFIKVLNYQGTELEISSKLIVIAGSSELSLAFKSLVVLVGKFFFRGKNDLVVDTSSMDFGAKRVPGNTFIYLEESGKIDHITYFKTPLVRNMIQTALLGNPEKFGGKTRKDGITFLRGEERGGLVLEGGSYNGTQVSGKKPIVILLPGIMGSNLKDPAGMLWINYKRFLGGDLKSLLPGPANGIEADSLIKTSYKKLGDFLSNTYDVQAFPFDWRLDMKGNADLLKAKVEELMKHNQPIKMVGHSMGGVLIRDFMLYHPETYKELNNRAGFKILFLGSPLGGSYRIPYVLFGRDGIIKLLAKIDIVNSPKQLMDVFVNFPGILALLPINRSGKHDFSDVKFWEKLRKASGDGSWPIPTESDLKNFAAYQKQILEKEKEINYENIYYIAGQSRKKKSTITDLEIRDGRLEFFETNEGDESVTWSSGIPLGIKEAKHLYYANVTHGALSCEKKIFGAIEDILSQGITGRLQNTLPNGRGVEERILAKEEEVFDISEGNTLKTLLGLGEEEEQKEHETPIHVKVSHGDLSHADYPVLAGHFQFDSILTSEKAIDGILNYELSRLLSLGLYPDKVGTHQIVLTKDLTCDNKSFKGTVVIGMGVPGELTPFQLMVSVSKGIARYLTIRNVRDEEEESVDQKDTSEVEIGSKTKGKSSETKPKEPEVEKSERLGISIIALATSYGGFSSDTSIRSILLGIQEANRNIRRAYQNKVKVIEEIEIIELFRDRALGILRTVKNLEQDGSKEFNISISNLCLNQKIGRLSRIPFDNTSDWWTRIKVTEEKSDDELKTGFGRKIKMAMATTGASENEVPLLTNVRNIESLLEGMTLKNQYEPEIAKTMFELLIPFEFKENLKRQNNITWVLDKRTANFPWEMLQEDLSGMPLCIHSGMVRQLATTNFRKNVSSVQEKRALVVGDPELRGFMSQLKGAEKEAALVSEKLKSEKYVTETLINSNASQIILKLFTQNYKIIHLAGHGVFHSDPQKPSGMVIGNGYFLTPSDIAQMSKVPEFVFVNCCYLGQMDNQAEEFNQNRNKLAANIGTQLIEIGVKAVIVAGWAVDDAAALDFCEKFYKCLFCGDTFGESTKAARAEIYRVHGTRSNTWGAYQCYGDPFFKIEGLSQSSHAGVGFYLLEEVEIDLYNLGFQLESKSISTADGKAKLLKLEEGIKQANLSSDKILEYRADVHAKLGDYQKAMELYQELSGLENAGYSVRAMEQYCNISCKYWVQEFSKTPSKREEALKSIDLAIAQLGFLNKIGETSERYSLIGSAFKRQLTVIDPKSPKLILQALKNSAEAYVMAAKKTGFKKAYPVNNAIQLGRIYELATKKSLDWSDKTGSLVLGELEKHLKSIPEEKKEFWDLVTDSNILLSKILLDEMPAEKAWKNLKTSYENVWKNAGSASDKMAEIEHLNLLILMMGIAKSTELASLSTKLQKLKQELEAKK
ncbi:CHAT domain-containing protein [Algoriphagus sp. A40]|uniref:CHAT domain-containing protein n=1 Tax=Algoriphagus sp. A40 TaxID=1945863 RepID=UPI00098778B9|nr:CHAT domain-containing protein [Algoriphagus sp. A40]OOG77085.1 hypothetical protein B0E43_05650 [Algoriphagus sp. A40]